LVRRKREIGSTNRKTPIVNPQHDAIRQRILQFQPLTAPAVGTTRVKQDTEQSREYPACSTQRPLVPINERQELTPLRWPRAPRAHDMPPPKVQDGDFLAPAYLACRGYVAAVRVRSCSWGR
jgi:hypothetical protein